MTNLVQAIEEINNISDQQQLLKLATNKLQGVKELVRKTKEQTALEYYLIGSCANRSHCLCTIMNDPEKYGSWEKGHKDKYLKLLGKSHGYLSSIMNYASWTGLTDYAELGPSVLMSAARAMKTYFDLEALYNPQIQLPKYDVTAVYDFCDGKTIANNLKDFLKEIARKPNTNQSRVRNSTFLKSFSVWYGNATPAPSATVAECQCQTQFQKSRCHFF